MTFDTCCSVRQPPLPLAPIPLTLTLSHGGERGYRFGTGSMNINSLTLSHGGERGYRRAR